MNRTRVGWGWILLGVFLASIVFIPSRMYHERLIWEEAEERLHSVEKESNRQISELRLQFEICHRASGLKPGPNVELGRRGMVLAKVSD